MNRIYTCYKCGFVWKCDEEHIPKRSRHGRIRRFVK